MLRPLNGIYGLAVGARNLFHNSLSAKAYTSTIPTIIIGNYSTGGTGKTPMSMWLIQTALNMGLKPGFLSRGYGRKTKGLHWVDLNGGPQDFGDEPFSIKNRFPNIPCMVCEDRVKGVLTFEEMESPPDLLILDDAFQHLPIRGHYNILLSRFDQPYFSDRLLPSGNLREKPGSGRKPDLILFTKTPSKVEHHLKEDYRKQVQTKFDVPVFFSGIDYGGVRNDTGPFSGKINKVIAVSGIAQNRDFIHYLSSTYSLVASFSYKDHHAFSKPDREDWIQALKENPEALIITTEKDWVRIPPAFRAAHPLAYLPIEPKLPRDAETMLKEVLRDLTKTKN